VRQQITVDSPAALKTYTKLHELSVELSSRNEKAWVSMIHLTEYVEASTRQLWQEMEDILSVYNPPNSRLQAEKSDMIEALKLLDWPNPITASHQTVAGLAKLKLAIQKLSVFQPSATSTSMTVTLPSSGSSGPLLPFKIMTKEIEIRFRYHFEGNRPTNNLEKVLSPVILRLSNF
jgi:RAD50-interacting protein 1